MREEGSIILNRLIEGARRRIRLRLEGKRPSMLPPMKEVLDEILRRSCLCASYCESRIIAEHGCQINRADLFSMFSDSLRERNHRPWTREDFNRRSAEVMKRAFGSPVSNSLEGGKGFRSVRFKTPAEIDNDD